MRNENSMEILAVTVPLYGAQQPTLSHDGMMAWGNINSVTRRVRSKQWI
jgi:hypothetical protein